MSAVAESQVDLELLAEVSQFLYYEARLADEHRMDDWEALWADDAIYWVPANGENSDPETQMSILHDNRSRIALRVKQLKHSKRHTQNPRSRLRRLISNIEIVEVAQDIRVEANMLVFESNMRGDTVWGARNEYTLRRSDDGFSMVRKKVVLVNNEAALYTLSFLI